MGYLTELGSSDVVDALTFAHYAQQTLGTPRPRGMREVALLTKKLNDFFADNPTVDYRVLVRTVDWCRAKKRRPAQAWGVLANVRWAWADGLVPEMDARPVTDPRVEAAIRAALEVETDVLWRNQLLGSEGLENRRGVLHAWRLNTHNRIEDT